MGDTARKIVDGSEEAQRLCELARKGNVEQLKRRVNSSNVNVRGRGHETPLMCATRAYDGCLSCAEHLLQVGADPTLVDWIGKSAMHVAAFFNNTAVIQLLHKHNESLINLQDNHGDTPLMLAAAHNKTEAVMMLIQLGADLSIRNKKGETAADKANEFSPSCDSYCAITDALKSTQAQARQQQKQQLNNDLAELRLRKEEEEKEIQQLLQQKQELQMENQQLKNEKQKLEQKNQQLKNEKQKLEQKKQQLEKEIQKLEQKMQEFQVKYQSIQTEIEKAERRLQEVKQELENVKKELENADNPAYTFSRGLCLIVNIENYETQTNLGKREGSQHDVSRIENVFGKFGFHIETKKDLKGHEIFRLMYSISARDDLNQFSCLVCFLMGHGFLYNGENDVIVGSDGGKKTISQLALPFESGNCPELSGKPKIFFIQACRRDPFVTQVQTVQFQSMTSHGVKTDQANLQSQPVGATIDDVNPYRRVPQQVRMDVSVPNPGLFGETVEEDNNRDRILVPNTADFLFVHANTRDHPAYRNPESGSVFVQCLCKILDQQQTFVFDLESLITKVNREVTRLPPPLPDFEKPVVWRASLLTKRVQLHRVTVDSGKFRVQQQQQQQQQQQRQEQRQQQQQQQRQQEFSHTRSKTFT